MSKSWAPAPEGQPVHSTKIRIIGTEPGTPEYNAVLDRHRGQIDQFLRAQHQRAQLSGLLQHKASIDTGEVTMTYHNNQGQDTLTIDVRQTQPGGEESKSREGYFDFALLEIEMTGLEGLNTDYELAAFLAGNEVKYAHDNWRDNSSDKTLRFADVLSDNPLSFVSEPDVQRSSLLIDLRSFQHPGGVASIDLFGFIYPQTDDQIPTDSTIRYEITGVRPGVQRQRATYNSNTSYNIDTDEATFAKLMAAFPEYAGNTFRGPSIYTGPDGTNGFASGIFSWEYYWDRTAANSLFHNWDYPAQWSTLDPSVSSSDPRYPVGMPVADPNTWTSTFASVYGTSFEEDYPGGGGYPRVTWAQGVHWTKPTATSFIDEYTNVITNDGQDGAGYTITGYDYQTLWLPEVTVYLPMKATVRCVLLKGNPLDSCSGHFNSETNFYQWENSNIFPDRVRMGEAPTPATFTSQDYPDDDSLQNKFGLPKIGTVRISPAQSNAGFNFKPV